MQEDKERARHSQKFQFTREARVVFANGGNVEAFLRSKYGSKYNTPDILEISYDVQAGSYVSVAKNNAGHLDAYTDECASILDCFVDHGGTLLDLGTGEMTTISHVVNKLGKTPKKVYALDISWSRLFVGLNYLKDTFGDSPRKIFPLAGDVFELPFLDFSVDVLISNYVLYAYHGKLDLILPELYRITKKRLVLFEPYYEIASVEGKARMDSLSYIRDLSGEIRASGGKLVEVIPLENNANPLTPTACFVIDPPARHKLSNIKSDVLSVPGANDPLELIDGFYLSREMGICFPVIKSIPILKMDSAILASALVDK